ncbi:unnamed protein product [Medioppia subpectinata]|uniref:Tyrosinase copper-binding domain-containing protein n=1 Tax=Medioppia subpectinata TaxID=1979941 RepID=A0A7R9Q0Z3_9ACAR|nr:unnamed protein product [Medioppia subpectinata]CAG2108515.1 unnamed protein product [Medioppia subpectinata]
MVERARLYLIDRFTTNADIKPSKPPCVQLKLRRDFKCMSEEERQKFVDIIRRLYLDRSMDMLGDIHARHWGTVHKSAEFSPFHRYIIYKLEEKIATIDPTVTVPYWSDPYDFSAPEKSILFKYFGTYGQHVDGFCVKDGLFTGLNLTRCVRRQWYDGKMPTLESPEMVTSWLQRSTDFPTGVALHGGSHFVPHLAVGGYAGDMSVETAAHDILFYMFHQYYTEVLTYKLQLKDDRLLTPLSYNLMSRVDTTTGAYKTANIYTDVLTHWTNVTIAEVFHLGFGEFCSISDRSVLDINRHLNGERPVLPNAIQELPQMVKTLFFPAFASDNYTWFDVELDDTGDDCNPGCKPVPKFQAYSDTPHGIRMMRGFDDNSNPLSINGLALSQMYMFALTDALNMMGYCSPFIP